MTKGTVELTSRIAVVFDFDDTLAHDSLDVLLEDLGADPRGFRERRVTPRIHAGWDPMPAAFYSLIELARERGRPLRRDHLEELGRGLDLFPGIPQIFDRLRGAVAEVVEEVDVEFYVVSCGISEIIENTALGSTTDAIYASRLHYDERGEAVFIERIVSHAEKTGYLYGISQGPSRRLDEGEPFRRDPDRGLEGVHVPFHQMIYVGDGLTDLPAFGLIRAEGGFGIGVMKDKDQQAWVDKYEPARAQRLVNLARADYSEGSELTKTLDVAVRTIAQGIALRRLGNGGSR